MAQVAPGRTAAGRPLPVRAVTGRLALAWLAIWWAGLPTLAAVEVSDPASHADWPSAAFAPNGDLWVAWCAYDGSGSDVVQLRRRTADGWGETMTVTPRAGDLLGTSLAVSRDGRVWVAWAEQTDGNFDLFARSWHAGNWDSVHRVTEDPQPDLHQRLALDSGGNLHVVWQSFRTGDANVYHKSLSGGHWSPAMAVTTHEASDWEPAIAVDSQDRLFIVYDTYRHGDYDVYLRILENGVLSREFPIADSPHFEGRASIALDREDRAWIAWDDQGPAWALDQPSWTREARAGDWGRPAAWSVEGSVGQKVSLRYSQKIGLAVFAGGQRWRPGGGLEAAMENGFAQSYELPEMAVDSAGTPRLFLRRWVPRDDGGSMKERPGAWNVHVMAYAGDRWSAPVMVKDSSGSNDQAIGVAEDPLGRTWIAYASDDRWTPGGRVEEQAKRARGKIRVQRLPDVPPVSAQLVPVDGRTTRRPFRRTAWTDRRHTITAGENRYHLLWGDLHRHTEISGDGGYDGTLWDMYRYALDVAELDFVASTDHFYGADAWAEPSEKHSYDWWRTQKLADLFHVRRRFLPLFGYERSIRWPYGHRNIISPQRGATAVSYLLPRDWAREGAPREPEELRLWAVLQGQNAISIPHTIAAGGGTNFAYHDPVMEPLLEIYQGCRLSYEAAGAPRVSSGQRYADGLAQSALNQGYRMGFIASSDHRSTHISYAAVYAEEPTREGIFAALRRRHAYAATDNIVVDVRMGQAIMGDAIRTQDIPDLQVAVRGTAPIHEVQVIRNGTHVYTARPGTRQVAFTFRDADLIPGESYYYVRIQQEDGQLAWASPIWVDFEPE